MGDLGNLWGGHGLFGRINGSLQYTSPEFAGLKMRGLLASGEGAGGDDDVWMTKVDYGMKSLKTGFAYMNQGSSTPNNQQAFACTAAIFSPIIRLAEAISGKLMQVGLMEMILIA